MASPETPRVLRVGDWQVEPELCRVTMGTTTLRLRPQLIDLLLALADRPGAVISKDALILTVWKRDFVADSVLTTAIAELRQALGDCAQKPHYIETISKRGYRLVATVTSEARLPAIDAPVANTEPEVTRRVEPPAPPRAAPLWLRLIRSSGAWAVLGVVLLGTAVWYTIGGRLGRAAGHPLEIARPAGVGVDELAQGTLSPRGDRFAYIDGTAERTTIKLQNLSGGEPLAVEGTAGAVMPFFSPDESMLGFVANSRLQTVALDGGDVHDLAEAVAPFGATWRRDGSIVFAASYRSGLMRVDAAGGTAVPFTTLDAGRGEASHRYPDALPNGSVIFTALDGDGPGTIQVVGPKGGPARELATGDAARFAPPGHLVYSVGSRLVAAPFDPDSATITGDPTVLTDHGTARYSSVQFSVAASGALAYVPSPVEPEMRLVWADRRGSVTPLDAVPRRYAHPRFSPDGSKLALWLADTVPDIWTYELAANRLTRVTFEGHRARPTWSPDGRWLVYDVETNGSWGIVRRGADGSGAEETLVDGRALVSQVEAWTPDGRAVIYNRPNPRSNRDLWIKDIEPQAIPRPLITDAGHQAAAALSPDGRWMAFVSVDGGRPGIEVTAVGASNTARWLISNGAGREPVWSRDGREIFFRRDDALFAVPVRIDDASIEAGTPVELFRGRFGTRPASRANYDVSADGSRFLMLQPSDLRPHPWLMVIQDWRERAR